MTYSKIVAILYKEYLLLRRNLKQYTILLLFYWFGGILGLYSLELAVSVGQMLFLFAPFALFRQEEEENFRKYMILLGEKEMVAGRYLFTLILCGLITMLNLIYLVFCQILSRKSTESPLLLLIFTIILGIFLLSISFPLFYAYDTAKAKPWFFLLLLFPIILTVIFHRYITLGIDIIWKKHGILPLVAGLLLLLGMSLMLAIFSYHKSVLLLREKDFS